MNRLVTCLAALLLATPAAAGNVGFILRTVPNGTDTPLTVGIWYPTDAPARATPISLFTQTVAEDAPVSGIDHPLVVISHGNGGEFAGHSDTAYALAQAGFIVAAPTHTGDNYRDQSRATDLAARVRQLSATIDYVEHAWQPHAADPSRIGAFGFSSGGLTVLLAAGGQPDMSKIGPHCHDHPDFFDCRLMAEHHIATVGIARPVIPAEPRLRAIVVAAPALGYTLAPDGLRHVSIPVQLWRADNDAILPAPFYADAVRAALPTPPEFHNVPRAGHFDFLAPCSEALTKVAAPVCVTKFDRVGFHVAFDEAVVGFFKKAFFSEEKNHKILTP